VIVIDFWATWCVPCKVEIPHYNKLREKYKDQGVEFVGVTFESGSNMEKILGEMKDLEIEYPVGMATDEIDVALGGHQGFPTTFVVGRDWKVYRKTAGSLPGKITQLEKDINELLAMSYD
jgi:thiol-disulfide isomerase/thioredoxin